ncbi:MAG: DEAD/DEAH box helicase family protein [Acidobacteria bacterium]|nr:DEAD/DEAH box helicase family protein [Acidobacteriota bacterium]
MTPATATLPQTLTPYHAKYYAYELTRRCPPDSDDRLASALVDAQVDLNPHQIDAALFSFKSPLSRGVLLADEVGLGKTIEAGLVLAQRWAERKRRVLVITPSNLRKQWHQELTDKFFLPCRILEAKSYNEAIKAGQFRPFEADGHVVICSYQFARNKAADVHKTAWDLVVMDEAHRLRNVYKPSNVIANTLKQALASAPKLLLTATPLQNSLLELFGLVSIIDDQVFGDLKSFREQFSDLTQEQVFATLKRRLAPICHRTLRRQVTAYVSYTRRLPLVEQFTPDASEDRLYDLVSEYLRRDNLKALPPGQRTLMTLVMRKLLASSSFAIAGALDTLAKRLKVMLAKQTPKEALPEELLAELDEDYEALDETAEEWEDDDPGPPLSSEDREALAREIADLEQFRDLAASITHNAKGDALLQALRIAFDKATELGGARKAIIFTESRKTQLYIQRLLADSPWKDGLVLFNGSNTDERSRAIYADWRARHEGTDQITGSKTADMRSALVDYFRDQGQIMIATEAGAEGINLQFCSLVVNYDLPWNPQRIEQRIGRCHRYGQKHDVVVVNFLNRTNAADQRVFQLLSEKFKLFEGVFGASDEVLGAIESGVDFEKRIASIYQQCRRTDEIKSAFDVLQQELDFEIAGTFDKARQQLLENFDDEVREKLRVRNESSRASLNRYEQRLMALTRFELGGHATFLSEAAFDLHRVPDGADVPTGRYELPRRSGEAHFYRLSHPLAETVVAAAKARPLPDDPDLELRIDYSNHVGKISVLEPLRGTQGLLRMDCLTVETLGQAEDHLLLSVVTAEGAAVPADVAARLFTITGAVERVSGQLPLNAHEQRDALRNALADAARVQEATVKRGVSERSATAFEAEAEKLDGWADDLKIGLEREIKELDRQIKEARRAARLAVSLEEKLASQKRMKVLESERNTRRRALFESQDEIDRKRGELIAQLESQLTQKVTSECLFSVPWSVR